MIAGIGFVVSCIYASELFDFAEIVFDKMPPLVGFFVVGNVNATISFCRNDGLCLARIEVLTQGIGVEGLVGKHGTKFQTADQVWHTNDFTALAGQKLEAHQIAQRIGESQNLGG